MSFGQILKKLREENNYTQVTLAENVGIMQQNISAYENDRSAPNIENLIKFAQLFNVSIDYLVGYSKIPNSANCFTEDQIELFKIYDALPSDKKAIAQKLLKALTINVKE
jgi:transcriptional regulator with XRE-family HTH domain